MRRAWISGGIVTALVVIASAAGVRPASAQVPPIPVPTPPPQLQPVFQILAPTLYPQCGTAALVTIVAGQSAGSLGPDLFSAEAPVFVICGQVPRPGTQLQCVLDLQQQAVISTVLAQAGAPLALGLHPQGDLVEQAITVEDQLPPQLKAVGAGKAASSILGCAPITSTPPTSGDFSSMPGAVTPSFPSSYSLPPSTPSGSITLPFTSPPAVSLPTLPPVVSTVTPTGEAVRYAAIWLLPLALLMFGGYFGGALTREVEPRALRV